MKYSKKTKIEFRRDGSIKSKTIKESKEVGMLPSYQVQERQTEWIRMPGRRRTKPGLIFCLRFIENE